MALEPVAPHDTTDEPMTFARPGWGSQLVSTDAPGWTKLFEVGPGEVSGIKKSRVFEMHSMLEEIVLLDGWIDFDDHYRVTAPALIIHPPFWVHPSIQLYALDRTSRMLIKTDGPVDFFEESMPAGWDGTEWVSTTQRLPASNTPRASGITGVDLAQGGAPQPDGAVCVVAWPNPWRSWTTTVWRLPPGWSGSLPAAAGDEVFVIDGDLEGDGLRLGPRWHYADPAGSPLPSRLASAAGALLVRWTKDA